MNSNTYVKEMGSYKKQVLKYPKSLTASRNAINVVKKVKKQMKPLTFFVVKLGTGLEG